MNEIYEPPKSNLADDPGYQPNVLWKILFWLHALFSPLLLVVIFLFEDLSVLDLIDVGMFCVITIGLWGFVYSKRIIGSGIWKFVSIFFPSWVVIYGCVLPFGFDYPQYGELTEFDAWLLIDIVFYVPSCFAIYFYAFRSNHIWHV